MDKMEVINNFITNSVCLKSETVENDPDKMQLINKVFPYIYVITLAEKSNIVRTNYTKCVLNRIGANYTIFYMVRPPAEIYKAYLGVRDVSRKKYKLSPSELGCLASHVHVLQQIGSSISDGLHLILEDDGHISKQFDVRLQRFISVHGEFYKTAGLVMLSNTARGYDDVKREKNMYFIPTSKMNHVTGTGAYAVNKIYANTLSEYMMTFQHPCDWHFKLLFDKCKNISDGFVFNPPLILNDITNSTIRKGIISSTDFHRDIELRHKSLSIVDYEYAPLEAFQLKYILHVLKKAMNAEVYTMSAYIVQIQKYKYNDFLFNLLIQFLETTSWSYFEFKNFLYTLPEFNETDWRPCQSNNCKFIAHSDTEVCGGTHCCLMCKTGGGHGPACEKLSLNNLKCARVTCDYLRNKTILNNGGTHCCAACKNGGLHGSACAGIYDDNLIDIDAVVTWADGTDPKFIEERNKTLGLNKLDEHTEILGKRREILYSLRGLTFNCPWLRTIYLVTNDQWPVWLDEELASKQTPPIKKISVKDIHPDKINVYGSIAIEALLHKIPGLSNLFLYGNADMFVGQPMKKTEWVNAGVGLYKLPPVQIYYTPKSSSSKWWEQAGEIEQIILYESKFPSLNSYSRGIHQIQIMCKRAYDIAEQTFPTFYNKTINTHGRILDSFVGRKLIDYIGLHKGFITNDNFSDAFFTDPLMCNIPTHIPKLLCVNINDRIMHENTKVLYNFLETCFPKKLGCEVEP
jgi:GR25 family glycosyltransferase involved in LPS biosynthesis